MAQAQSPSPGVYIGAEGGVNWLLNFNANTNVAAAPVVGVNPTTGWMAGGVIGYDFVGPRVELEGIYRWNGTNIGLPGTALNNQIGQLGIMANLMYDFMPASVITPYIGAGAGLGLVDSNSSLGSTVFAYQGIVGLGWNVDTNFRVNLDGRYYGTSNPTINGQQWTNNNFSIMLGLQLKFGSAPPPPAAGSGGCAAVVHGVLRLGPLEPEPAGAEHDQAGSGCVQEQGQRPHHGDRPH
jgi:opacity protein-like surface antigen